MSLQRWLIERDANERNEHRGLFFFPPLSYSKALLGLFPQTCFLLFLLQVFALRRRISCVLNMLHSAHVLSAVWKLNPLPSWVTIIFYYRKLMKYIEISRQHLLHEWEIDHPPLIRLSTRTPLSWDCTEPPPPLFVVIQPHTSLISIYLSFLDIITFGPRAVIAEHSAVGAKSRFLYIQSNIGVLYSTVTYVRAQDITWDWMWCSSNRRKRSLIVIAHFVSCFICFVFLKDIYSILLHFMFAFHAFFYIYIRQV